MNSYSISITEYLSKTITVLAESEEEALDVAREQYHNQDVVLDANDYVDTDIKLEAAF